MLKKIEKYLSHEWHDIRFEQRNAGVPHSVPSEGHYIVQLLPDLARRSLKRKPALIALMVLSIGVGIGLAMSTWTLVRLIDRQTGHLQTIQ